MKNRIVYHQLISDLNKLKKPSQSKNLQRFFKTGKGEYGAGDVFLGISVPEQRRVARKYMDLGFSDLRKLLNSKIHEYRLTALLILAGKYEKNSKQQIQNIKLLKKIFDFYLMNTKNINNWDLVDLSAPKIAGNYLLNCAETRHCLVSTDILYKLARSKNLWERRIAMVATVAFIRNQQFEPTLKIAQMLLRDPHDLIHKAVGWMLREAGKKDQKILEKFLDRYYSEMPRTMLRYAIERLPEKRRKEYLKKEGN